jgi:WD40 repeat protein
VCFSPDGQLLAISAGETVRLWDISGTEPTYASDLMGEGTKTAFSPDGRLLATGGGNTFTAPSPVSLLTLDGSLVVTLEVDKTLDAMAFRPDGRYLAVAARDGTVLIWDLNGMLVREIPKPGKPFNGEVAAIAWSTDLVTIAIAEGYCR